MIKKLIIVLLVLMPITAWSANLHYALDVQINTSKREIIGIARLKAEADKKIRLSIRNLSGVKVDGNAVTRTADENIDLLLKGGNETRISYEALFTDIETNFINKDHVFLTEAWYPQPKILVEYAFSVTLPNNFIATSEAETVTIGQHGAEKTFNFHFRHPQDALHLAASTRYVLKKDLYNNIAIEAYFFQEDAHLADSYIAHTKKYLAMYETMLTPYPYRRFAIVENVFPTGNSMPTYTLLGKRVVHLPFIVNTSLGHEILHQWFGNSVYIDTIYGNWAEGIVTYLADHHYAALEGKGRAYRKQIMVDYSAYVNTNNAMPISNFFSRQNKAQKAIGYGKAAMLFHDLRKRLGDKSFFVALREFIHRNRFRTASWHDIQRSFEKVTGEKLYVYFSQWLSRKDIPQIGVESAELQVEQGKLKLNFTLVQHDEPYRLRIPITLYSDNGKNQRFVEVKNAKEKISLQLDEPVKKVVIDENYALMRQLTTEEIPPALAGIMGRDKLTVIATARERVRYKPLIDAFGVKSIAYVTPDKITFTQMKENSLLIAGHDKTIVNMLFGKQAIPNIPKEGVRIKVYKNPYNAEERIVLLHVKNKAEAKAVQRKISHYGKYSELAFRNGQNTHKAIVETGNGISVLSRPSTRVLSPDMLTTVDDIMPKLFASRIIYIGEQHDKFAHHINQLLVIKKMHVAGYKLAVGMEMFQTPFQPVLDDYLTGQIDENSFLERSEYFSRWRYDYNLYKPIIDYLKQQNIPLIALNIEGDITRQVARQGIDGLADEKKKQLPAAMDFSNEQYRRDLVKVFTFHGEQKELKEFSYFYQAQLLWDEGMAESAYRFLANNPDRKLVVLAGNGHVRHKYGIPERLYRRNHEPFTVVVQDDAIEDGIADFVLLTTGLKGKKSPKLGLIVEEKDQTLVIMSMVDKSSAKNAGLQKGDIIKQFAGKSITSLADLKLALFYSKTGTTLKIKIKRDDKTVEKEIEL
ncbi:MAG: ChaN family lipoprotein [Desulfobacterales bacterium]|jgi:uncharacterized iron-regulated protein|nr:ChaN family lipoprotein [Desulfobacterales bacterium]MDP6807331.1 ChaN family lipoprotein [Desulfobacterales bacterium]